MRTTTCYIVSKREQERASDALDQKRIANVAIAVPPAIPTLPLASLSMVVMIGFVVAIAGSAGAAYAVEFLDSSFRTPGDVIDILGIPVVAAVPKHAVFPKHSLGLLRTGVRSDFLKRASRVKHCLLGTRSLLRKRVYHYMRLRAKEQTPRLPSCSIDPAQRWGCRLRSSASLSGKS